MFEARGSAISVGRHVAVSDATGLFVGGTSTVSLLSSSSIANPHSGSAFYNLAQADGTTSTLVDDVRVANEFRTGDATSTVTDDNTSVVRTLYLAGALVNGGASWNSQDALVLEFSGANFGGGDLAMCQ